MEEAKSSKSVVRGAAPSSDEERKDEGSMEVERGGGNAAATSAGAESRGGAGAESDEEDIITLGPGWMNRSGSRTLTLSGTRDFAKGSSSGVVPIAGGSKLLAYCYTKEEVLALHSAVADECPPDFLALPYILSEDPLLPVNLSQDLLKDFEELQRKYLYNICPSRASSSATRGGTRGRGRGRGRGSDRELRPRDKEGGLSGSSSGSGVYRPPRGRGRLGYSWEGESERSDRNERRPAWADTPIDKDAPKGRFSGGRFRGDSDSEGSELEELEDEKGYSDSDEAASEEEAPGVGWLYKDPQNIVRGPFSNKEMHEWYLGGFFPPSLPVKREGDEDFKALSTYEGNPFARQRKKKEKTVRREKLREMHAADMEGRGDRGGRSDWGDRGDRGDRGDWRKRSDQRSSPAEKAREAAPSKKADEKPKDEGNWRMDNTKDVKVGDKKPAGAAASPKEAPAAKKPEEKTPVAKNAEEIIKAAKEAERAKREKEAKERQESKNKEAAAAAAAAKKPQAAAAPSPATAATAKPKSAGAAVKRDSADMSDAESLDDILDHFPHLTSDLIASSDDEGEERPSPFPGGARPAPLGGWPATAKAPWSAQELEMRQFQHYGGPGGPMPAGDRAPMHGKPPAHHMHPHPQFPGVPGVPEGKAPFMQPPHHPLMGPGQPPQQFFPGMQPGFPPHAALPGLRPGVPAGPPVPHHGIPNLERRQGVFDMAAIEEQLMKQSHMPPEMRMHMQPHMPPPGPHVPPHAAPWLMAMQHGKPGHAPTLREIQEQEMRERQQRHPMPPQAFPHQFTPEQMLHHQMLSEQHKQQMHPLMRQQMAMGMRPQVDSVFQSVWGISPDGTPLSLQEIQARLQSENEEERRSGGAGVNDSVEQELHDDEQQQQQHRGQHHQEREGGESEADGGSTKQANDEEDIWDVPATDKEPQQQQQQQQTTITAKADQQQPSKKQGKQQQQQQKKKGNNQSQQQQQQQQPKQKGGAKAQQQAATGWSSGGAKPPSLKEIQEQEQREMLERQKQQKQAKTAAAPAHSGDGKNLQNLLSAWGFSSSGETELDNVQQPSWASMDETPSLRDIQEQEAAQREIAQMEEQQRKRQQQQQQAQQKAAAANEVAWTGGRGAKKPTLAEIQAEELKQQQKRQKELQQQHKHQLKAQREQLARFSSPWAGAAQTTEATPLSLREIQELEQRRAQEEASKKKKSSSSGGAEPITKLLWETRVGGNEPVPLSEIMAQEEAATQSDEPKPKKEAPAQPLASSDDVWSSSGSGQHTVSASPAKASLRDIQQQEEQKSGKQQQQQPQQQQHKRGGKGQQPSASGQQEQKSSKKQQQNQSPQKGSHKKQQQQQQQQQSKGGVWGAVPSAPKTSLLDIQVNQQRAVSPPPAASAPAVSAPAAPKSAPAPVVEDDFWGETPAPKAGKADNGSAPAIIDDSHFPALGGGKSSGANNAAKKGGQSQASAKKPANWAQKTTGATAAPAASTGGRRLASSGSSLPQQQQQAVAAKPKPTTPKAQQTKAGAAANAAGKKKMQKLDPSLLGFSSNLQDRIAQGQVLPIDE